MKERPVTERPYEKCLASGAQSLTDGELLAVILRCGTKNLSVLELACLLLEKHPVYKGISGLHHLDYQMLLEIPGIGKVKATNLLCVLELSKRLARSSVAEMYDFSSPENVAAYFMEELRHLEEERVKLLLLNTRQKMIRETTLSAGTTNQAYVPVREIFLAALKHSAAAVLLVHNHPSGEPGPSKEDILLTRRVKEAGELLDIPLLDHVIIGDHCYVSLKEKGLI